MPTDLGQLADTLDLKLANEVDYTDLIELLQAAVVDFNAVATQTFTLVGTTLDRDATALEQELLILYAMHNHLLAEAIKWSKLAITHSNVAGRTKLDGVEFALSKRANDVLLKINQLVQQISELGVVADVTADELGETLDYAPPIKNPLAPPYI